MKVNLIENSKVTNPRTNVELNLGDKSIIQGSTYSITFLYEGDYSLWQGEGEIKNSYYGKGGTLIASFTFPVFSYDSQNNKTTITCNLKASVTKLIPPTIYQNQPNQLLNSKTAYVYEIRLRLPSINPNDDLIVSLIEPSFVQVKPGVIT